MTTPSTNANPTLAETRPRSARSARATRAPSAPGAVTGGAGAHRARTRSLTGRSPPFKRDVHAAALRAGTSSETLVSERPERPNGPAALSLRAELLVDQLLEALVGLRAAQAPAVHEEGRGGVDAEGRRLVLVGLDGVERDRKGVV